MKTHVTDTITPDMLNALRAMPAHSEHDRREREAYFIFSEVARKNPTPGAVLSLENSAPVAIALHTLFEGMGGFLYAPPEAKDYRKLVVENRLELRGFSDADIASRARMPLLASLYADGEKMPDDLLRMIFLNLVHFGDQGRLRKLRMGYRKDVDAILGTDIRLDALAAAEEVTVHSDHTLGRAERIALYLYRELEGNYYVRTNYALTLREEAVHGMQTVLRIPYNYMCEGMAADAATPDFVKTLFSSTLTEQRATRDAGIEMPLGRMYRRLHYLLKDREMQARLDKVFCEYGHMPQTLEEQMGVLRDLGLATGGVRDIIEKPLWERSRIHGRESRALAELNFAIVSAFPDGVSDYFRDVVLPYHLAQTSRINSFDVRGKVMQRFGFSKQRMAVPPERVKKSGFVMRWVPSGQTHAQLG